MCGINYPVHPDLRVCQIHGIPTDAFSDQEPDQDWREKAQKLAAELRAQDEDRPFPRVTDVPITEEDGRLWVTQSDLVRAGFRPSVLAGGRFALFELDGKVYELQ